MKSIVTACALALCFQVSRTASGSPPTADQPTTAKFVIYTSKEDASFGTSLYRILRGDDKVVRIEKTRTIAETTKSGAEVIVIVAPRRGQLFVDQATLNSLKNRKVVGIGYGAAELFGSLGLEIHGGNCAHFGKKPPSLLISEQRLVGVRSPTPVISALKDSAFQTQDAEKIDVFAMHLPPASPDAQVVEAIARMDRDLRYAPIVRQGNFILIGIPVAARHWTPAYSDLIRQVCAELHERDPEPFPVISRKLTDPGTYPFKLARSGSANELSSQHFYFGFDAPTKFTARLEHSGSKSVMMLFMGDNQQRLHWTREDARTEEPLDIEIDVRDAELKEMGDDYWSLKIVNFGRDQADCKLIIAYE